MKTNMLGKIALAIKHIGKTRLDFTHDVSTTAGFGDMLNSKSNFSEHVSFHYSFLLPVLLQGLRVF